MSDDDKDPKVITLPEAQAQLDKIIGDNPEAKEAFRELFANMRQAMQAVNDGQYSSFETAMEAICGERLVRIEPETDEMSDDARARAIRPIIQSLMEQGLLLEAGWQSYRTIAIPINATPAQTDAFKEAFFAGAAMVFECMIHGADPEHDVTEADMRRMNRIADEIAKWDDHFRLKYGKSLGTA